MSVRLSFIPLLAAGLLLIGSDPASAQAAPRGMAPERSTARLVTGGLLGGVVGLGAGGLTGLIIGANHCTDEGNPDSCHAPEGVVYGAVIGQSVSIPLGVHLANDRAGSLVPSLLASSAIAAIGAVVVTRSNGNGALIATGVGVPLAQIASSVIIERATAGRRRR